MQASNTRLEAVVVGAGFGGLALAIRLQAAGFSVTVLEQRDKPGGRAYVYNDNGYTFDAGPTVITHPGCLEELFELVGRRLADYVNLVPVTPFYQLRWEDGSTFDYVNDPKELTAQISRFSKKDVAGYEQFLIYSNKLLEAGYVRLGRVPFPDFRSMVRVAPQLIKLGSYRSVYAKISQFISEPHLRQAFSFHTLLVGGNPFETSAIYALIHALERRWGVWFPMGGTGALIAGLAKLFVDLGGVLETKQRVDYIETQNGRVVAVNTCDGRRHRAQVVVSNADIMHTYRDLLRIEPRAADIARNLSRKRYSNSLFVIYFGLRQKSSNALAHHTVLFGPRYRELIMEIFRGRKLPEDFSLYLHAPSATDPSLAPPGCSAYYVLAPVPHLGNAAIDWTTEGPKYRDRILDYLERWVLPGLRADLDTCRIFTPADFRDELNAHLGSAFSLEPILSQSAYFRAPNADRRIDGLYLVGAGTHPGAGVPGVVGSAAATASVIIEDHGKKQ